MTTSSWLSGAAAAAAAAVALAAGCGGEDEPAACADRPLAGLFRPLSGELSYKPVEAALEEELQRRVRGEGDELVHGIGMRQVVEDGETIALALVAVAKQEQPSAEDAERDFVKGFGDDEGERVTVGGVEATQASSEGFTAIARRPDPCTLIGVAGQDAAATRRVAAALLR